MGLAEDAVVFGAMCTALAAGVAWRWRHVDDEAAAGGYRAGLWLLFASGAGLGLRIAGLV